MMKGMYFCCVQCDAVVKETKHRCYYCDSFVCKAHRGKETKGFFSKTTYFCIPSCPPDVLALHQQKKLQDYQAGSGSSGTTGTPAQPAASPHLPPPRPIHQQQQQPLAPTRVPTGRVVAGVAGVGAPGQYQHPPQQPPQQQQIQHQVFDYTGYGAGSGPLPPPPPPGHCAPLPSRGVDGGDARARRLEAPANPVYNDGEASQPTSSSSGYQRHPHYGGVSPPQYAQSSSAVAASSSHQQQQPLSLFEQISTTASSSSAGTQNSSFVVKEGSYSPVGPAKTNISTGVSTPLQPRYAPDASGSAQQESSPMLVGMSPAQGSPPQTQTQASATASSVPQPIPFPMPESVDKDGNRAVLLPDGTVITVVGEKKIRLLKVVLAGAVEQPGDGSESNYGLLLGVDDRGRRWAQLRDTKMAVCLDDKAEVVSAESAAGVKCKHCGAIVLTSESDRHVATHKKSGRNTQVGENSNSCGDLALLNRLKQVRRLGKGAQGDVWLCEDVELTASLPTSEIQAGLFVRKDMKCASVEESVRKYQQSVRVMDLEHHHIIRYLAVKRHLVSVAEEFYQIDQPTVTVVMPYFSEGDVANQIRCVRNCFNEHYVCSVTLQLAGALEYLHSRQPPIIHGDIKPENILLFNKGEQVVLMDLDAITEVTGFASHAAAGVGTSAWMAPEAINHNQESTKSDIWSLGVVMYCMAVLPEFPLLTCDASGAEELLNSESWEQQQDKNGASVSSSSAASSTGDLGRKVSKEVTKKKYSGPFGKLISKMVSHRQEERPNATQLQIELTEMMTAALCGTV